MEITTDSAAETKRLGEKLAALLISGDVICFYGDLGSGKTTFIQGLALGLGIKQLPVSPTFIFVREYRIKETSRLAKLYHIDLYRLEEKEELQSLGITSILRKKDGVVVIEWAEKAKHILPDKRLDIYIYYEKGTARKLRLFDTTGRNIIHFLKR